MEKLTEMIRARVTPRLKRVLQEKARRDRRSLSDTIRLTLEDALAYDAANDLDLQERAEPEDIVA